MSAAAILGGLTAGGLALAPWLMRTLPGLVARGSGPVARKKLLEKAGRAVSPLHGGRLARGAKSGAYGLGAAAGVDAMFGGQPAPEVGNVQGTTTGTSGRDLNSPWNPSKGLMDAKDAKRMRSETFWGNMNKMMQMSAILNATGGDTSGFQKMMGMANKKVLTDMDDQRDMDIYDSVFQQGNMPNTAIEAYERMIASKAGPEAAAKVAGQYVKMRDIRVNNTEATTRVMNEVQTLIQAGYVPQAKLRFKNALAYGEIKSDYFKDPLGNTLVGQALDDRIDEMVVQMGAGIQEAG